MDLTIRPHLLSTRDAERYDLPEGMTIAELVRVRAWPAGVEAQLCALIDGVMVPRHWWTRVRPRPGASVTLAVRLQGGQGGGKQILALVAVVVVAIFAQWAAPQVAAAIGGGVTANMAAAGIMLIGNLAIGAIFKPPSVSGSSGGAGDTSNAYSFQGQSNAMRPYGVIPRVLGMHRMFPDLVAAPYTQTMGNDNYLVGLYSFGYGPCDLNDICIGEIPIEQYSATYVVHKAFVAGDMLQIYINDMAQESLSLALSQNNPIVIQSRPLSEGISFDLSFGQGLGNLNKSGGVDARSAFQKVEFKRASDPDSAWQIYTKAPDYTMSEGNLPQYVVIPLYSRPTDHTEQWPANAKLGRGTSSFHVQWPGNNPPPVGTYIDIAGHRYTITGRDVNNFQIAPAIVEDYYSNGEELRAYYYHSVAGLWEITRARAAPFISTMTFRFAEADTWQIRITQTEPDSPEDLQYIHKRSVVAVRSERISVAPIAPDKPITVLELKVKATDQLSGVIQNLNAVVSAHHRHWDGAAWVTGPTSNPAWGYLDLLQGPANKRPIPDSRIDLEALKAWAVRNDTITPGFQYANSSCNFIVDKPYTLWDLLSSVAATGRAMPTMRDNKYSVIVDTDDKTPVQIFTPRNSWGLTARRKYVEMPDALRVKWIDPAIQYQENQAIVYNDGYNEDNAVVFEEMLTFGVTIWEQAHREGRVAMARGKLQQEEFSISADVENIICVRGDMIGIVSDVMEVGGWSARIATRAGDVVTFDADLKPFNGPLGARVRTDDGALTGILTMQPPPPPGDPYAWQILGLPANAKPGDLVVYGTVDTVMGYYLVKGIEPGEDFTAQIACIEYAPGVYQAELGPIPDYVPQGQSVGQISPNPVQTLTYTIDTYYTDRYPRADVSLQWSRPIGSSLPPSFYIIWEVALDGTMSEIGRTEALTYKPLAGAPLWMTPYGATTVTYAVTPQWPGIRGPGAEVSALLPLMGLTALPPLTSAQAVPFARGVAVTWDASGELDLAYYVVRYGPAGTTWEAAAATEVKIKANHLNLPATFLVGNYVAMVLQEDTNEVRSAHVAAPFTIIAPQAVNVVGTAVQNTAFLRWGTLSAAGAWSAQTMFQIEYYEVQKTRQVQARALRALPGDIAIPAGVIPRSDLLADQPQQLGKYSGEFAVINEQQEGLWQYCMRGVDIAGNPAPFSCVTLLVNSPDNYFLLDSLADFVNLPETTRTNTIKTQDGKWLAPLDVTSSWAKHFEDEGWDQPSDQVAAGFPMYAQPAEGKSVFSWQYDYTKNLPSLRVTAEAFYTTYGGTPDVVVVAYAKANAGDAWAELARGPVAIVSLLPPGTRYVRVDIEVTTDAARKALALIERGQYRLDVQFRDDAGTVTTPASGTAVVTFNIPFLDVRSVQLTSADPAVAYARYQVATDQKSMTVYTFNSTGAPVGGKVAWMARGI